MKSWPARRRKANPVAVSGILRSVVDELGVGNDIDLVAMQDRWPEIVGPANARNTRPVSLDDAVLTVSVTSPAWMTQARFYKADFMKKVNAFTADSATGVSDVRFKLDTER